MAGPPPVVALGCPICRRPAGGRPGSGGGPAVRVPLEKAEAQAAAGDDRLLAIHEALDDLAAIDPEAATLVKLRFFAGRTAAEAAKALGLSVRSAHDLWAYARSWLRRRMRED